MAAVVWAAAGKQAGKSRRRKACHGSQSDAFG
jgi:hypothetical protein